MAKKNRKVETIVVAHTELVSDWDAKDKRSSDYGTPPVNTGRETRASWRDPIAELVPLLADGYDPVKGAVTAVRLDHYQELTGRTGKDILSGQLARADAYADSEYSVKIAMTGDLDNGAVSRELDGRDVAAAIRRHYESVQIGPDTLVVVTGQRRMSAIPVAAMVYGAEYDVPVVVREFDGIASLREAMAEENSAAGRASYDNQGLMALACSLRDGRPTITERELAVLLGFHPQQKGFKGRAQKFSRWSDVHAKWPRLKIGERVLLPPELDDQKKPRYVQGGFIPVGPMDKELPQALLGRSDAKGNYLRDVAGLDPVPGAGKPAQQAQVEQVLRSFLERTKSVAEVLDKGSIRKLADSARIAESFIPAGTVLSAMLDPDNADAILTSASELPAQLANAAELLRSHGWTVIEPEPEAGPEPEPETEPEPEPVGARGRKPRKRSK